MLLSVFCKNELDALNKKSDNISLILELFSIECMKSTVFESEGFEKCPCLYLKVLSQ
jgi:hypothetical protein